MSLRSPLFVAALAITLPAAAASAQLVFGTTTPTTTNPATVYLDVVTGQTTTLWNSATNKKVNGLAADEVGGKLYANDAARLNVWNYNAIGTAPTLIGGMYRTDGSALAATGFSGLAFANGSLYGSTSFQSTIYTRGIYRLPTVADANGRVVATQVWAEPINSGSLQLEGIEYYAPTNRFYGVQDAEGTFSAVQGGTPVTLSRGLYAIDVFGGTNLPMVKIADFPAGQTRIDGLAMGGGRAWLTVQNGVSPNTVSIFPYNLSTGQYEDTITFALTDGTNRATGAAWAPHAIPIAGDYNLDGLVDAADYTVWADHFGQTGPAANLPGDGNKDGVVDAADYTIWADHFGAGAPESGPPVTIATPEPTVLTTLLVPTAALRRRRR